MKLMIIKNSRSYGSFMDLFRKNSKSDQFKDCSGTAVIDLLLRERPLFVYLKLKEPVNGDDDMMTMLGSIDVNTRLRVSIINTESIKNYINSILRSLKGFILPGRQRQNLDTP
jgi:hypothetical protein